MNRNVVFITFSVIAGNAAVYSMSVDWIKIVAEIGAVCAAVCAIFIKVRTRTPRNPSAKASVLLLLNFPENPLAKVKEDWALTAFFASAFFLISLALSVMVRASI